MSNLNMQLGVPQVANGLQTMAYTVPAGTATQFYSVQCVLSEVPPSGISVLIKNNGATKFTSPTLSPTQSAQQFKFAFPAAASDAITVVYQSSSAIDSALNGVVSITSIYQGL